MLVEEFYIGEKMKKVGLGLLVVLLLTGCTLPVQKTRLTPVEVEQPTNETVKLVLNDGQKTATYSAMMRNGLTALDLTQEIAAREKIELKLKEYDFGVMLESILGKMNTADKAWILFVNGAGAAIGAGEQRVTAGDVVEWRYITPSL